MNRVNFTRDIPRIAIDFNGFASILQGRGQGKARNVISCGHLGSKMVCIVNPFRKIRAWNRVFLDFGAVFLIRVYSAASVFRQIRMYTARFECIRPDSNVYGRPNTLASWLRPKTLFQVTFAGHLAPWT